MKPYYQLTEAERLKLSQIGLLWELYPEAENLRLPIPDSSFEDEEPDHPEMVAHLQNINNVYTPERFDADISAIALAWEIQLRNKTISDEFDKLFQETIKA